MKHTRHVPAAGYADGAALDRITYLEAKLILKPEPFTSVRSFRDFGRVVKKTARASGVDPKDRDLVLSLLAIEFDAGEDGAGLVRLLLAGDGEIALDVECLEVALTDVTQPYVAPSGKVPGHPA